MSSNGTAKREFGFNTQALHAGYSPDPTTGSRAVPIYQTTSYQFKNTDHARIPTMPPRCSACRKRVTSTPAS